MIPPEPGPDPPVPTVPLYTYYTAENVTINGTFPGVFYRYMHDGATDGIAGVNGEVSGQTLAFRGLLVYEGIDQFYHCFAYGTSSSDLMLILAENSTVGGTHPLYTLINGTMAQSEDTVYVAESVPVSYFNDIKTNNYMLESYADTRGVINEPELNKR